MQSDLLGQSFTQQGAAAPEVVISLDEMAQRLSALMRAALEDAAIAQAQGKSALRALRQATRCIAPLLRLAPQGDTLNAIIKLILATDRIAADGADKARALGQDASGYHGVQITCYIHLARIAARQAKAATRGARAQSPAKPAPAPKPVMTKPPQQPITQRARWLAEQRRKGKGQGG